MRRRDFLRAGVGTGAGLGAAGLVAACGSAARSPATTAVRPRRGGSLKLGLTGGSATDTINPGSGVADIDYLRIFQLYQPLVWLAPDARIAYVLAESITPEGGSLSRWVIRLRPGITFHSGKPLTAADVLYTFHRILAAKLPGSSPLAPVDLASSKALDDRTVLVQMTRPYGSFVDQLASVFAYLPIVPAGFTDPARPDGTGPFVFRSFTPGQRSVYTRNPNYWKAGLPYADTLTVIDFADSVSLQDALITGQIHGAGLLDGPQMSTLGNTSGITAIRSTSGSITPFTMRVDQPPFSDVRVRQAMRLLIDRPLLIESALDGCGTPASDVFSPYDPDFDRSLHRELDLAQARYLLKKAGREDFTTTLVTSPVATGTVAMATVLAQQAKAAGVTIRLRNVPPGTFFGPSYLQWEFSQDYYPYSTYLGQVAYSMLKVSPFNEIHINSSYYAGLFDQANSTSSPVVRKEILRKMQEFDFAQGGYIIPSFIDALDAYSNKIAGYSTDTRQGNPLSNFDIEHMYFK